VGYGLDRAVGYGLDRAVSGWDRWRALVNTAMNLRVPSNMENFLSS
jgi:hypothetical protein